MFCQYIVELSTLIRKRGGFSKGEKLGRIYMNMSSDYKMYATRQDFINLTGLLRLAEEYKTSIHSRRSYPPPSSAKALVPETAYDSLHCA